MEKVRVFEFAGPLCIEVRSIDARDVAREQQIVKANGRTLYTVEDLAGMGLLFWEGKIPSADAVLVRAAAKKLLGF